MLHRVFLNKNSDSSGVIFFLICLKHTEKADFGHTYPNMCGTDKKGVLPLTAWDRFHHCNPFSGFNQ